MLPELQNLLDGQIALGRKLQTLSERLEQLQTQLNDLSARVAQNDSAAAALKQLTSRTDVIECAFVELSDAFEEALKNLGAA